ncbi:hypothetical protein [Sulfurimonas sp.]|uniref:hypothetical protein n=1 Tax=Sulfurimonas sp. TaxID=2022749 RepID=UPI0025F7087D|nr:hypothetical protein [Sulfurimonas sp.]MDD5157450.1 hypothetical protein [Sulfurimonas sp.]
MSIGLDKLKSIGVQKIHETTHISTKYIQAIFHENFEDMHQVQFLGFLSILEREYGVELEGLRNRGLEYFGTKVKYNREAENYKTFTQKKKRNFKPIYISVVLVLFILFSFVSIRSLSSSYSETQVVDNRVIESAKNNIYAVSNEANISNEQNKTVVTNEQNQTAIIIDHAQLVKDQNKTIAAKDQKPDAAQSFKIVPRYKVWVGFVDLNTSQKSSKTFSDELVLDPNKDWALSFGHGFVGIEINGVIKDFSKKERLHLLYKNKELKEISFDEYKALGKGAL